MTSDHIDVLRALVAAQTALFEYADEDISVSGAKATLLHCLVEATKRAKKLEN